MSPRPPCLRIRNISPIAALRRSDVDMWWITAIEIDASNEFDLIGRLRQSPRNTLKFLDEQISRRFWVTSVPIRVRGDEWMYLPFPQPMSRTRESEGREERKDSTCGHGL